MSIMRTSLTMKLGFMTSRAWEGEYPCFVVVALGSAIVVSGSSCGREEGRSGRGRLTGTALSGEAVVGAPGDSASPGALQLTSW